MTTRVARKPRTAASGAPDPDLLRAEWLAAARAILLAEDPKAITISRLARDLGVSRGAFYWHFETRDTLMADLRQDLEHRCTPPVLQALEDASFDAGILALLDSVFVPCPATQQATRFDAALRIWGQSDGIVQEGVVLRDLRRNVVLRQFLRRAGYSGAEARVRGRYLNTLCFGSGARDLMAAGFSYATDLPCLFEVASARALPVAMLSRHLNRTLPARRKAA